MPDPLHPRPGPAGATPLRRGLRRSARLASFSACLEVDLLRVLRGIAGVVRVDELPEAFEWLDGLDGTERMHLPLARVERSGGDVAYVDAMPRSVLERDPTMGGVRVRVELECAARGASYEVWTEDEIRADPAAAHLARVADTTGRALYVRALCGSRPTHAPAPPVVALAGDRLGLDPALWCRGTWIGRSRLTGIPMALLYGLATEAVSGMAIWRPHGPAVPAPARSPVITDHRRPDLSREPGLEGVREC